MPAQKGGSNVVSLKVIFYCSAADKITQGFVGQTQLIIS